MALVIELGAPTAGANSYASEAELDAYLALRGYTVSAVSADKEILLVKAFDFMESLTWRVTHDYEFTIEDNMIPAQCEIAYRISEGLDPTTAPAQPVVSEQVDSISVTYATGQKQATSQSPYGYLVTMPQAHRYLKALVRGETNLIGRA